MKYEKVKLKDITLKIGSGSTPRGGKSAYLEEGEICLIRSQNVYNHFFSEEGLVYINDEQAYKLRNVELQSEDILINITGDSVARTLIIDDQYLPARVNQHVSIIRCDKDKVCPQYLLAILTSKHYQSYLLSLSSVGGTRAALTKKMLEELEIELPDLNKQQKIGFLFSTINEKIKLNNVLCRKLEELAQTLFKRWFVDFEFPNEEGKPYKSSGGKMIESELGMIPEGWEVGQFSELYSVKSGYAFKSAWWSDSGVPVIKIKDIENNTVNNADLSFVSFEKSELARNFKVNSGDILIALTGATAGKFALIPKFDIDLLVNQRVGKFYYNDNNLSVSNSAYLFGLLLQKKFINRVIDLGSGSAQSNISPSNIAKMKVVLPNKEYFNMFNANYSGFIKYITELYYENEKLIDIRDTLLPKLLSGEIELQEEMEVTDDVPIS